MIRPVLFSAPLLLILAGCHSAAEREVRAEPRTAPIPVHTTVVSPAEWPSFYDAVGTVRARTSAQVSARVMAAVREVLVRVGDRVREGQPLVMLDARDLEVRRRQADAALAEAKSADAEARNAIESAKANLELTETTFRRMKDLHEKTSISNQEFDEVSARLRVAKANMDVALSHREQAQSKIEQAKEAQDAARIQREYASIVAPFAGVVTEKMVEPGNMVTPGAPLLTIERAGAYRLEASVEESNLPKVRRGLRAGVTLDALDRTIDGTVSEVVPAVDPASRAFIAKVDLPSVPNLRSGQFGRARFATGASTVLAVPATAVLERGQIEWVFVVDGDTARGRIVTLGRRYQENVEVLSGLKAGERIVTPVSPQLTDGVKVELRQ